MICADIQRCVLKQEINRSVGVMCSFTVLCTEIGEK